jgi:hypothetical protein
MELIDLFSIYLEVVVHNFISVPLCALFKPPLFPPLSLSLPPIP